jgi:hypothetical protein
MFDLINHDEGERSRIAALAHGVREGSVTGGLSVVAQGGFRLRALATACFDAPPAQAPWLASKLAFCDPRVGSWSDHEP